MKDLLRRFLLLLAASLATSPRAYAAPVGERISGGRASALIQQHRLRPGCSPQYLADGRPDPAVYDLVHEETTHNVVTTVGRDRLHLNGYGTTGLATNGFNYVALSNDALTETSASTTLSKSSRFAYSMMIFPFPLRSWMVTLVPRARCNSSAAAATLGST